MREPTTLYFIMQPGCPACAKTKPHVTRFEKKWPAIRVERIDLTETPWPEGIWGPKVTPTFVLTRPGHRARTITGERTLTELERWLGLSA